MPEIKNNFLQGKMNKDLDERLIPNGQYRDAMNIEVSTAEDSSVGTVKNILGNKRVEDVVPNGYKCVGSIANEKTNRVYWFVSSYSKDAIIEYDAENDIINHVLVDAYAGTSRAVLMFSGNIITGINIIDDLLLWTDNNSTPKKINIKECIKGTASDDGTYAALDPLSTVHTQILHEHGSFDGLTIKYATEGVGTSSEWEEPLSKRGRYFWFQEKQLEKLFPSEIEGVNFTYGVDKFDLQWPSVDVPYIVRHYRDGEFLQERQIKVWNTSNGSTGRVSPWVSDPGDGTYTPGTPENEYYPWRVGDVLFGKDITKDIEERHITVIKPNPSKTLSVKINYELDLNSTSNTPNIFETKFPRFSYRYKYRDGEFSCFAPFTNPVFNPKYTKNKNKSVTENVFYNKDTAYDIKDPHNNAMVNSIHSIELCDFITPKTPEDVVEIDILYKQEDSPVIYSIGTIKHTDPEWHDWSNNEGTNIGLGKAPNQTFTYLAEGGYVKGKYTVTTENIYAALPANQILRPWDNVPRKALAQEVTGNRIVYGNYLQNYNLGIFKPKVKLSYGNRTNNIGSFDTQGLPSIKSQRNYQLGVVYCDKYGRETPVLTSNEGAVSIPWKDKDGSKNASKSLQLNTSIPYNFPEWVDSLKFFVKETSSEYYNLTMDRAWVTENTYELDNSEGHLWISFPSSDRNKISEEDYIILKKKIGVGEEQVNFENKFKVIDIKNEAPDAIKYQLVSLGVFNNDTNDIMTSGGNKLFTNASSRIDKEVDTIVISHGKWKSQGTYRASLERGDSGFADPEGDVIEKNLYISWRRLDASGLGPSSKKYKVTGGWKGTSGYVLELSTPITKIDADIAHVNGDSSTTATDMHQDLIFQVEERILKDAEDFSGKFFVKISKNQVTDLIESGNPVNLLDKYQVQAKSATWYWQDDAWSNYDIKIQANGTPVGNYGLTNWNGYDQDPDYNNNSIQIAANNNIGNVTADNKTLRVTDWVDAWDGILSKHNGNGQFFIDGMHVASGQSDVSDYAKYNCITWAGAGSGANDQDDLSAWSYPPLKIWLTDFKNKAEFLDTIDPANLASASGASSSIGSTGEEASTNNWFKGELISTSPESPDNTDWNGLNVDGWVGSLQNVNRTHHTPGGGDINVNQINGLEGFVTTLDIHAVGARRWLSGISGNPTDHGVGVDTKTYSDKGEIGRHFMHLSFFAPGKDLHDNIWDGSNNAPGLIAGETLYGTNSIAANLQGIWGGGHFTPAAPGDTLGSGTIGHQHLAMEGNYDSNNSILEDPPGPGIGYGYDINYRELHERQWDPTFGGDGDPDNKIRDFIRNLYAGSQFKFSTDSNENIYTIKKVVIKKLYNHTSWRKPYNRFIDGTGSIGVDYGYIHGFAENLAYKSVEQVGLDYLDQLDDSGIFTGSSEGDDLKSRIVDFGKASNRRLCYIIELDKNPVDSSHNPIANDDEMSADVVNSDFSNIEFLEPVRSVLLSDLSKFPAIWEVDPKKKEVDLDIYYEASGNIPVKILNDTNELFAPIGCTVEVLNSSITGTSKLMSWDGYIVELEPGFPRGDGNKEIDYTGMSFKFTREDGSYTIAEAGEQWLIGSQVGYKTNFGFREDIGKNIRVGLSWYNCFSFGNGIESNRIKDGFNEMFITNGVKASTTTQETYEEERRAHGLIYSGLYNSNSGVNDLNQFIMAEKITKDLNPTYGSIQKLYQRRISLIAFCEDRVLSIMSNKDAIYNADGNMQLVATENVLGDVNPFVGDYGISRNPESFASETYRAYFTDKSRGAVLRLSKDGLTPISKTGMHDWFRDNLPKYTSLIGTYDGYKEDYNITLSNAYSENIIYDSFLGYGEESTTESGIRSSRVENSGPFAGSNFQFIYETIGVLNSAPYTWGPPNDNLNGSADITNHAGITAGSIQPQITQVNALSPQMTNPGSGQPGTPAGSTSVYTSPVVTTTTIPGAPGTTGTPGSPFVHATYSTALTQSGSGVDGHLYSANFTSNSYANWGPTQTPPPPVQSGFTLYSETRRYIDTSFSDGVNGWINESNPTTTWSSTILNTWGSGTTYLSNGSIGKDPTGASGTYPVYSWDSNVTKGRISGVITHNTDTGGGILFDRVGQWGNNIDNWVEFRSIGAANNSGYPVGQLNDAYTTASGNSSEHTSVYNGDEIHIQIDIKCYGTLNQESSGYLNAWSKRHGYNVIEPQIQLYDGLTPIDNNKFVGNIDFWGFNLPGNPWNPLNSTNPNPYEHVYSHITTLTGPYSLGTTGGLGYTAFSQGSTNYHAIGGATWGLGWPYTNQVTWNSTSEIDTLYDTTPNTINGPRTKTITLGASFKFRDPAQQNADGSYSGSGDGIEEVKVVDDLRIRINQVHDGPANAPTEMQGYPWMCQPLWEIQKVKIIKGYGVTAPHQDVVPSVPGTPPGAPTVTTTTTPGYYTTIYHHVGDPGYPYVPPTYTTAVSFIHGVAAVPSQDVPAWTEVDHNWLDDYVVNTPSGTAYTSAHLHGSPPNNLGHDYGHAMVNSLVQNPDPSLPPVPGTPFKVPQDWVGLGANAAPGPQNGTQYYHSTNNPTGTAYPGIGYGTSSTISYTGADLYLQTNASGTVMIEKNISSDPWVVGDWYLVDVEYDETFNPDTGAGYANPNGSFSIDKLGSVSGYVGNWNQPIDPAGVGVYRGGQSTADIQLVKVLRTEYGTQQNVLRAIFKVPNDCWRATNSALDHFALELYHCTNPVKIQKIITRNISTSSTNDGSADDWVRNPGLNELHQHAFDKPEMYWRDNKLCFNADSNTMDTSAISYEMWGWYQNFGVSGNPPAPEPTGNWKLKFTVSDLPTPTGTDAFTGSLRGWVLRDASGDSVPPASGVEGIVFKNINDVGQYQIDFTTDGDNSNWTIEHRPTSNDPWTDYSTTAQLLVGSSAGNSNLADQISFRSNINTGILKAGISNIFLTDETQVFLGGDAGSWNFDGFNTSAENYIHWDMGHERLNFWTAPAIDPVNTIPPLKFINVNQWIDNTTPIPRYAKYRVEFDYLISSGSIRIYYFNSDGYGFVAYPVSPLTATHYDHIFTIGDDEWSPINPVNNTYSPDLKESFVISLHDEAQNTTGWIDNISMKRVYDITIPEKTVSFSEDVNGWTSFKSFTPESGVSVSKKYFTINDGGLWQHYIPMVYDTTNSKLTDEIEDASGNIRKVTAEEASNYNVFYSSYSYDSGKNLVNISIDAYSKVKLVLNNDPSTIKTFNTLNYEGGQTYVIMPTSPQEITMDNIKTATRNGQPYNADIEGWYCSEIKTDKDTGSIKEFIEKEGKWFNYIKGKTMDNVNDLDTSLFSVQGVGMVSSTSTYTP